MFRFLENWAALRWVSGINFQQFQPGFLRIIDKGLSTQHAFWAADVSLLAAGPIAWQRLLGHRQVADAYLLALAVRQQGRLVTFDQRISTDLVLGAKPEQLQLIA